MTELRGRTRWGELLDRKPELAPTSYYVAERGGRLFGRLFCTGDVLEVGGQPDINPAILREISETEWQAMVAERDRRLAEMFPEAERGSQS